MAARLELGRSFPASRSAAGRVLLAGPPKAERNGNARFGPGQDSLPLRFADELTAVRDAGYSTECGEMISGVNSVAAPIIDRSGNAVAAFSVLTNDARSGGIAPTLIETVTSAAAEVSRKLGYHRTERRPRSRDTELRVEVG